MKSSWILVIIWVCSFACWGAFVYSYFTSQPIELFGSHDYKEPDAISLIGLLCGFIAYFCSCGYNSWPLAILSGVPVLGILSLFNPLDIGP